MEKTTQVSDAAALGDRILYTIGETARLLSLGEGTIRNLMDEGLLDPVRIEGIRALRFHRDDILRLVASSGRN